jgi:hypothetical protein
MSWMKSVYSSMVSEIGYDDQTGELLVRWAKSGKTSAYAGVPEDVAFEAAQAASVGEYINSEIKPNYGHKYR